MLSDVVALVSQAKEGLALINGTQTSASLALHGFLSFEPVLESALVIGALTVPVGPLHRPSLVADTARGHPGVAVSTSRQHHQASTLRYGAKGSPRATISFSVGIASHPWARAKPALTP